MPQPLDRPCTTPSTAPALTRREALAVGVAGAVAALDRNAAAAARKPGKVPIGLQLYSLRDDCAKDFDGTLAKVAELGFTGVEFAGYHKYKEDAAGLRKKLDELKLKAAGAHVGSDKFGPEKFKATVEFHKTLGCSFLIVPGDKRFTDPEGSKEYAKFINDTAAALKAESLFIGHHNHMGEFKKEGDKTYYDLFAERTHKEVILQQDIGWTVAAGLDPIAILKRYPGRTRTCHVKAKLPEGTVGKKPFIGQDVAPWKKILKVAAETGGAEWFTLEQEDYPDGLPPLECVKMSLVGLKKILA